MLTKAALLRAAVAVDGLDRVELLRLRLAVEPVLEVGADDRRGSLRPKRQRATAAVFERVHLLLDDIRARARRAREELGVLEDGRLDAAVTGERAEALDLARDALPERLFGRQDVVRSPRRVVLGLLPDHHVIMGPELAAAAKVAVPRRFLAEHHIDAAALQ